LSDGELAAALRKKGLKRVTDFSGARKAEETVAIYRKICGRN
jgi:hypothetical protein